MDFPYALLGLATSLGALLGAPAAANPTLLFDAGDRQGARARGRLPALASGLADQADDRLCRPSAPSHAGELALDSPIKVTKHAAAEPPSKMGFKPGSVMTLDNALKMMLVKSANDIAMAVGENVGGSRGGFRRRA